MGKPEISTETYLSYVQLFLQAFLFMLSKRLRKATKSPVHLVLRVRGLCQSSSFRMIPSYSLGSMTFMASIASSMTDRTNSTSKP